MIDIFQPVKKDYSKTIGLNKHQLLGDQKKGQMVSANFLDL
jgi:hypothetical protein